MEKPTLIGSAARAGAVTAAARTFAIRKANSVRIALERRMIFLPILFRWRMLAHIRGCHPGSPRRGAASGMTAHHGASNIPPWVEHDAAAHLRLLEQRVRAGDL